MTTRRDPHVGGQQLPLIVPESSWVAPTSLPDLRGVKYVALDRETKDDGLASGRGPGWAFKAGHVAGTSIAWREGSEVRSLYVSLRHPDSPAPVDPATLAQWERDHSAAGVTFVMHNGPYDVGWGEADLGVPPPQRVEDTTAMAFFLDEARLSYQLDDVCRWRGVPGKDERALREAAAAYGWHGDDVKKNLWRLPARFVGPYAEADAVGTLLAAESMRPDIVAEGSWDAFEVEMDLIPCVHAMRRRGIRVDLDRCEQVRGELLQRRDKALQELAEVLERRQVSMDDIRRTRNLEVWFDAVGIRYPRTMKTGQGSFKAEWMRKHQHPLPRLVCLADKLDEAANKFVGNYLMEYAHRGRLHANFNQFRSEEGGTKTHRFSIDNPPLQQMPARDEEMATLIRGAFLPEEGELWCSPDYSQQEYRLIVHFAARLECAKAAEAAQMYVDDPDTDFHMLVVEWTGLDRKPAKDTNFAKAYRAGVPKFASMIGKSVEEAQAIYDKYDQELPFVRELAERVEGVAKNRGYVRLLDGARIHYDRWEPAWRDKDTPYQAPVSGLAAAHAKWPGRRLKRAFTYKAVNDLIQGSAARQTKRAMRDCFRAGYVPLLQIHDELPFSLSSPEQGEQVRELMVQAAPLRVPMKVDVEFGTRWGNAKHTWAALQAKLRAGALD